MKSIDRFKDEYSWLSNMYVSPFMYKEKVGWYKWKSVEHFYQAMKSNDSNEISKIRECQSPYIAKKMGKKVKLRDDWNEIKLDVMRAGLAEKFKNVELREKLMLTGGAELVEGNEWHDTYWGVYKGVGQNMLGKLLMELRDSWYE